MRVRRAGYLVGCAEDAFVHHFGQGSIGRLAQSGAYGELFHANRERWEAKWETKWLPHAKRARSGYDALVERVRRFICESVPPGAVVLVVTKGDDALLTLEGRRGWHFPQRSDGAYAGHYPPDSDACIDEFEELRTRGAEFFVVPETSRWWLEHYAGFADHLATNYRVLGDEPGAGVIFGLVPLRSRRSFEAGPHTA